MLRAEKGVFSLGINHYLQQYQRNQIETADGGKLLLMLYEGALRFLGQGRKALAEGDLEVANNSLLRAQDIVAELISSLNLEAGEVAVGLFRLYEYMHYLLVEANIKKRPEPLEQVEKMLLELKGAWKEALFSLQGTEEGAGVEKSPPGEGSKRAPLGYGEAGRTGQESLRRVNLSG